MTMIIRDESPPDTPIIHTLTREAFIDAPHAALTEHFIVDALRKAGALFISLVAEDDCVIVGHVAVSPVSISDGSSGWYGLGPISVDAKYRRQGISSRLMGAALQRLRDIQASGCVLVGDPAYYVRFGFKPEASLIYPGVPPEYFQAIAFGESLPSGIVRFHAAFDAQS